MPHFVRERLCETSPSFSPKGRAPWLGRAAYRQPAVSESEMEFGVGMAFHPWGVGLERQWRRFFAKAATVLRELLWLAVFRAFSGSGVWFISFIVQLTPRTSMFRGNKRSRSATNIMSLVWGWTVAIATPRLRNHPSPAFLRQRLA